MGATMLIAMAGLPATGKSTIAQALAEELPAVILNKDEVRAALFPPSEIEYSTQQDDFCLDIMLQVAEYMLRKDRDKIVILDGRTFSRRYQIDQVAEVARKLKVPLRIIECVCSDETARRRLAQDADHVAENRDFDLYLSIKARFEPIEEPKLVVDTDDDFARCLERSLRYVKGARDKRS
ncbi:MAG: Cytidylate kinase [Anaerolineales bacterium]|nr:Cytidylate kinase [Anaerolineales bacterium]